MAYINHNGIIKNDSEAVISINNRGFKYADGFFETIKILEGKIKLSELHLQRLYSSLSKLKFEVEAFPTPKKIADEILELAKLNQHEAAARIRVTVFAGEGNLNNIYPRIPNYTIQSFPIIKGNYHWTQEGLSIDVYKDAVKPVDNFSSLKTSNFLPYVMASIWAKENSLDDALLLNPYGSIADATIANIFIVKDGLIKTPPITDGCVDGIMRKYLLKLISQDQLPYSETSITYADILEASEVFLTNAIIGIKWVSRVGSSNYTNQISRLLFDRFVAPLNG